VLDTSDFSWSYLSSTDDQITCPSPFHIPSANTCLQDLLLLTYSFTVIDSIHTVTCTSSYCQCQTLDGDICAKNLDGSFVNPQSEITFTLQDALLDTESVLWEIVPEVEITVIDGVMTIAEDVLEEGTTYRVECTKYTTVTPTERITQYVTIYASQAPEDPTVGPPAVSVIPESKLGDGYETLFSVMIGYKDLEDAGLVYKYLYQKNGEITQYFITPEGETTEDDHFEYTFSPGNSEDDYQIDVTVLIYSIYGPMIEEEIILTVTELLIEDTTILLEEQLDQLENASAEVTLEVIKT
jgi:hypothetical protein